MENYPPDKLDGILSQFYAEIRKQDGSDYEPDCLRVMQSSLHRHLVDKKYQKSILTDIEFSSSRAVLEGKARKLRQDGKGKRPNASTALNKEEEEILWSNGRLGDQNPTSLVRTMWYLNTLHFGLRGVQEHTSMTMENFRRKIDENGNTYIEIFEDPTKTRQSGLHPNMRVTNTKMFATGGPRCPVKLFDTYVAHRPDILRKSGRFYLTPKKCT